MCEEQLKLSLSEAPATIALIFHSGERCTNGDSREEKIDAHRKGGIVQNRVEIVLLKYSADNRSAMMTHTPYLFVVYFQV